jgi:hypothetical protein
VRAGPRGAERGHDRAAKADHVVVRSARITRI